METIIVGVNETPTSARAAERAGVLGRALGARLVVVTAYGDDDVDIVGVGSDTFILSSAQHAADFADQVAERLRSTHGVEVEGVAKQGKADDAILGQARELGASLIVVGNVRMQGAARLLGSVANDIAHHAPCDVYIVKTV